MPPRGVVFVSEPPCSQQSVVCLQQQALWGSLQPGATGLLCVRGGSCGGANDILKVLHCSSVGKFVL